MKKIIKYAALLIILFAPAFLSSCHFFKYDLSEAFYRIMKVELRAQKLTVLKNEEVINSISDDDEYDVLIITDVHFGDENNAGNGPRPEKEWFEYLNTVDSQTGKSLIQTSRFCICLGDVSEYGLDEEFLNYKEQLLDKLNDYNIPVYNIVGNHDLYNSGWTKWTEITNPGTSFYKFETPKFSWYFIDSASGTLGGIQYELLDRDMSSDSKAKFVFSHFPLYAENYQYFIMQNSDERNKLINSCAKYNTKAFIEGHTHYEYCTDYGKFKEYNIPGYLQESEFAVLHINEKEQTFEIQIKKFK